MLELHAIFKGRVQGVGFRWTVVDHAEKYQLTGTVKNLSNGTVEVIAQGSEQALKDFLSALQSSSGPAQITSVQAKYRTPTSSFSTFGILR